MEPRIDDPPIPTVPPKVTGWRRWWFTDWRDALLFFIIVFSAWSYHHDVGMYTEVFNNVSRDPCAYCTNCGGEPWMPTVSPGNTSPAYSEEVASILRQMTN